MKEKLLQYIFIGNEQKNLNIYCMKQIETSTQNN